MVWRWLNVTEMFTAYTKESNSYYRWKALDHTAPLISQLRILNMFQLHKVQVACFMLKFVIMNYQLTLQVCFKLIQMFTCTPHDLHMTTIFHFQELIYSRILFEILVQCYGTLLTPILNCYQMLTSSNVHINNMCSQKTRQSIIFCSS